MYCVNPLGHSFTESSARNQQEQTTDNAANISNSSNNLTSSSTNISIRDKHKPQQHQIWSGVHDFMEPTLAIPAHLRIDVSFVFF